MEKLVAVMKIESDYAIKRRGLEEWLKRQLDTEEAKRLGLRFESVEVRKRK